jgi:hypothetical protein
MATQKEMKKNEFLEDYAKLCEKHNMVLDSAHPLYIVIPKNLAKPKKFSGFVEFVISNIKYIGDGYAYIRRQWGITA